MTQSATGRDGSVWARERYRVSILTQSDGRVAVMIGAFVYDPGDGRKILDTWAERDFADRAQALAWIEQTCGSFDTGEWLRLQFAPGPGEGLP